jgi:hypothetical protein
MAIYPIATAAELQPVLDVVNAGDIVRLQAPLSFEGEFYARNRGTIDPANPIIIESDTPAHLLPGEGYRIFPSYSSVLAKLVPIQLQGWTNTAVLRFDMGANGYLLRNVEILGTYKGGGAPIIIGGDNEQNTLAEIPHHITIDRVYLHGHVLSGLVGAIFNHGDHITIKNSYLSDVKGAGQDAVCIGNNNCRGPLTVINNYLEGAGYCFITGGTDPKIFTSATIDASPAPTTSSVTLSTIADLANGQMIAMHYTSGFQRRWHPYVTNINAGTRRVDFSPACPVVPDVPGNVMWGVNLENLTFRRNHLTKNLAWRDPILATPSLNVPTTTPGSGLAAGTYYFVVQAKHTTIGYQSNHYYSAVSNERTVVLGSIATVTTTWGAITNADLYRVYRYQKDGSGNRINGRYFETASLTYTDTGIGGTVSDYVSSTGTKWIVKNHFELKMAKGWQVDSNILEYCWSTPASATCCVWLKCNNQIDGGAGGAPYAQCRDGVFELNWMRHTNGGIDISDQRATGENAKDFPEQMSNIIIRNNLLEDSGGTWGTSRAAGVFGGPEFIKWHHNTLLHTPDRVCGLGWDTNTIDKFGYHTGEEWLNNLCIRGTYGFFTDSFGEGKDGIDAIGNGTIDFNRNVIADAPASLYNFPGKTNYFPTSATFQSQFKNWNGMNGGDYRLKRISEGDGSDSLYLNAGTDGLDIGCNITALMAAVAGVIEGTPENVVPVEQTREPRVRQRSLRPPTSRWS